ncbi:MAG: molybdopterin-dependent oxidoreductase, partial [Dehalococcoidia bacterium]|nr:molybdopterin-dependent oxidoreductase [Dehalococcoidia bacterium]
MAERNIALVVNGERRELGVAPRRRLLDVLRDDLMLMGTKEGCGQGQCGACSVLIDGVLTKACLTQVGKVEGKHITTIEGLGSPANLHPLQEAFVQAGAIQCGFCTPGMIMAAKALLDRNPKPSRAEVKEALVENLCRCTGYYKIIDAVMMVADGKKPSITQEIPPDRLIGARAPRVDGVDKATGLAKYGADFWMEGMLYAQVLRSPHPHARILGIDTSEALRLPGVEAVVTAKDIPGVNRFGIQIKDQQVLVEDKVRKVGDAVAAVAATTEAIARQALSLIKVDYEPLESVFDPLAALEPQAPQIHEKGNLLAVRRIIKGDVEKGFAQADLVVENVYSTPFVDHGYIEPEAGVAYIDESGRLVVFACNQGAHYQQEEIATLLGIGKERIRVIQATTGGGFGGKNELSVQGIIALLAYKLKRPVKFVYSRRESFETTGKAQAYQLKYKTGIMSDGRLTAVKVELLVNGGAYASASPVTLVRAVVHSTGPYYIPNVFVEGKLVYTNTCFGAGLRGFGVPQVAFAAESQMD